MDCPFRVGEEDTVNLFVLDYLVEGFAGSSSFLQMISHKSVDNRRDDSETNWVRYSSLEK